MRIYQQTINDVEKAAMETTGWPKHRTWSGNNKENLFRSLFGCSSKIVAALWERILDIDDDNKLSIERWEPLTNIFYMH